MEKTHRSHDEASTEMFRRDPALAAEYLNDVLASGDEVDIMLALRSLSSAFGGVQEIARLAEANPNTMYRTMSKRGNPSLRTLRAILGAMGLRLAVQPMSGHPAIDGDAPRDDGAIDSAELTEG
jgi:DNA-binding phage protein